MSILKFYHKHKDKSHKEIYDMYNNRVGNECVCGNQTEFISLSKGYKEYCSIKCKDLNGDYKYDKIMEKLVNNGKFFAKQFIKIKEYYNLLTQDLYLIKYPNSNICQICNGETNFINFQKGFLKTCSYKCGATLPRRKLTDEEKQSAKIKRQQTCLERYGVLNNLCLLDNKGINNPIFNTGVLEKKQATMLEKYGTIYPLQNKEIMNKMINNNLEKYSIKFILEDKNKKREGMYIKYNVEHAMHSQELVDKFKISRENNITDRRECDNISGYVYILEFPSISKIKIGLTNNYNNRFKELHKQFGEFNIMYLVETNSCYKLEKLLHRKFSDYRSPEIEGCGRTEFFKNNINECSIFTNIPEDIEFKVLINRE